LAKELCKCAQRLVPREKMLSGLNEDKCGPYKREEKLESGSISPICQEPGLRRWPQQNDQKTASGSTLSCLERYKISERQQREPDIIKLRGELSCLKRQLWTQAQLVDHKTEACKIQALWRALLARSKYKPAVHMRATLKAAVTAFQARCRAAQQIKNLNHWAHARHLDSAQREKEAAALRLQAVLRGAAQTRIRRLKRVHGNNLELRCDLAVCNATIIKLYEEINCMRMHLPASAVGATDFEGRGACIVGSGQEPPSEVVPTRLNA